MKRQRSQTASRRENDRDRRRLRKANQGTRSQLHRKRHHVSVGSRQPFEHSSRSAPGRFTPSSIAVEGRLDEVSANFSRSPFIPANILNEGLADTHGKQYSFFV